MQILLPFCLALRIILPKESFMNPSKIKNDNKPNTNVWKVIRFLFVIAAGVLGMIVWNKPWIDREYPEETLVYQVSKKLYSINFQTHTTTELPDTPPPYRTPRLSPNGQWLISWQPTDLEDTWNLILQHANSDEPSQNLGVFLGARESPRWSSDSQLIVFSASSNTTTPDFAPYIEQELWITNIKTGELKRITHHPGYENDPCFSPDGTQIVYAGHGYAGGFQIYILDLSTGESRHLNYDPENLVGDPTWWALASEPVWSHDGQWIVFSTYQSYENAQGDTKKIGGLWIIRPDGTGAKQISSVGSNYYDWID